MCIICNSKNPAAVLRATIEVLSNPSKYGVEVDKHDTEDIGKWEIKDGAIYLNALHGLLEKEGIEEV